MSYLLVFFLQLFLSYGLRDNEKSKYRYPLETLPLNFISAYPLVPDYSPYYYYPSIRHKMAEAMSVNNCTMAGANLQEVDGGNESPTADFLVKVISPPKDVIAKWDTNSHHKKNMRIFTQVSNNLCASRNFRDLRKGFYKRAKGCYQVYAVDKNSGKKRKRFNDYGATMHPEHVRCDNIKATSVCEGGVSGITVVDRNLREMHSFPFVVTTQQAVVARSGMVALPCGPFGLLSSCEAVNWGLYTANALVPNATVCRREFATSSPGTASRCPLERHKRVFVLTQYDDTQIGQFMQEALPKLVFHMDFLLANPDIKIHFGFTKQPTVPNYVLPHIYFNFLGLGDRLINGSFYADKVIIPREGGCQDVGYNAWEVVTLRERMIKLAGIVEDKNFRTPQDTQRRTILVLTRTPGRFTQNKAQTAKRMWPKDQMPQFLQALKELFPKHDVDIFSDTNSSLMQCPLCQARAFHRADIAIGFHGAGLSNAYYMRPGGVVVEVVYDYDARHLPLVGIFPRISDIIGLHHYQYYVKDIGIDMVRIANHTAAFASKARLWSDEAAGAPPSS